MLAGRFRGQNLSVLIHFNFMPVVVLVVFSYKEYPYGDAVKNIFI